MPWGQRAGEVMAAMTATPESVRVGFRTSIPRSSLSAGSARAQISALLGREARPSWDETLFLRLQLSLTIDFAGQDGLHYASQLNFQTVWCGRAEGMVSSPIIPYRPLSSAWACINCC